MQPATIRTADQAQQYWGVPLATQDIRSSLDLTDENARVRIQCDEHNLPNFIALQRFVQDSRGESQDAGSFFLERIPQKAAEQLKLELLNTLTASQALLSIYTTLAPYLSRFRNIRPISCSYVGEESRGVELTKDGFEILVRTERYSRELSDFVLGACKARLLVTRTGEDRTGSIFDATIISSSEGQNTRIQGSISRHIGDWPSIPDYRMRLTPREMAIDAGHPADDSIRHANAVAWDLAEHFIDGGQRAVTRRFDAMRALHQQQQWAERVAASHLENRAAEPDTEYDNSANGVLRDIIAAARERFGLRVSRPFQVSDEVQRATFSLKDARQICNDFDLILDTEGNGSITLNRSTGKSWTFNFPKVTNGMHSGSSVFDRKSDFEEILDAFTENPMAFYRKVVEMATDGVEVIAAFTPAQLHSLSLACALCQCHYAALEQHDLTRHLPKIKLVDQYNEFYVTFRAGTRYQLRVKLDGDGASEIRITDAEDPGEPLTSSLKNDARLKQPQIEALLAALIASEQSRPFNFSDSELASVLTQLCPRPKPFFERAKECAIRIWIRYIEWAATLRDTYPGNPAEF